MDAAGVTTMPYPAYAPEVRAFFERAGAEPWCDYEYSPEVAGGMLEDPEHVAVASIDEIRSMLTYGVRGERFWDGHWVAVLENGKIAALLARLAELRSGPTRS